MICDINVSSRRVRNEECSWRECSWRIVVMNESVTSDFTEISLLFQLPIGDECL